MIPLITFICIVVVISELELLLKLYIYRYSFHPWSEWAFTPNFENTFKHPISYKYRLQHTLLFTYIVCHCPSEKMCKLTGKCAKLKANPNRPALSTILCISIHAVNNKIDFPQVTADYSARYLKLQCFCCKETWHPDNIPYITILC